MEYFLHIVTIASLYAILATSLDLVAGRLGLVSLAHAAFFGTGAYVVGVTAKITDWSPVVSLAVASSVCTSMAALVALVAARLKDEFFVIATFALQMVFMSVVTNWVDVTGGPTGISSIPRPEMLADAFRTGAWSAAFSTGLLALTLVAYRRIDMSPLGRGMQAVRDSEAFAQSLGLRTFRLKVKISALSGAVAGLVGGLYTYYTGFIAPAQFGASESIFLLTMVILGGASSVAGAALGAVLLTLIPEALRFLGLPGSVAGNVRQILYGLVLVVLVLWWPRGLLGRYDFGS